MTALALRSSPIRTLFARPPTLWFWLLPAITALAAAAYLQVAMDHIDDYTAAAADVGEIRAYAARIEYEALARPAAPSDLSNLIDVARTHTQQAIEQMQSRVTPLLPAPSPEQVMADFNELAGIAVLSLTLRFADDHSELDQAVVRLTADANALLDRLSAESALANTQLRRVLIGGAIVVLVVTIAGAWTVTRLNAETRRTHSLELESEERHRVLVAHSQNGLLLADEDGLITLANDAICSMFGYTPDELVGQPTSILYPLVQREAREAARARTFEEGTSLAATPTVCRHKDGSEVEVTISLAVLQRDGHPWASFTEYRDLREETLLREQLMRSQRLEAVGTLVAGVAHDFNNLLMAIGGSIEQVQHENGDSPWLDHATVATARASELVEQLLRFSTRSDDHRSVFDIAELAEEIVSLLHETIDRRITIDVERSEAGTFLWADRGQIHQVLMNLLLNARDAITDRLHNSDPGASYEPQLTVTLKHVIEHNRDADDKPQRWVELCVTDNGTGMPFSVRKRIFDPFFTTKENDKGTGLGLSTVYSIVRDHDGSISVDSTPGTGSTFIVRLPHRVAYAPAAQATGDPHGMASGAVDAAGRVLVVDDEIIISEIFNSVLRAAGYEVVCAVGGQEALRIASSQSFDLVLLDINMPGIDGWHVLELLLEQDPSLPVVMVSGYVQHDEAIQGGARHMLQKPFESSLLLAVVEEHIRAA